MAQVTMDNPLSPSPQVQLKKIVFDLQGRWKEVALFLISLSIEMAVFSFGFLGLGVRVGVGGCCNRLGYLKMDTSFSLKRMTELVSKYDTGWLNPVLGND